MGWWISRMEASAFIEAEDGGDVDYGYRPGGEVRIRKIGVRFRCCTISYKLLELYEIVQGGRNEGKKISGANRGRGGIQDAERFAGAARAEVGARVARAFAREADPAAVCGDGGR